MPLVRRLTIALVTMATLATTLAVVAQDLALNRDLESAAAARLERSARAGERVVAEHLRAFGERYQAIARTPQLRATLELNDLPTLGFLAGELARLHQASAIFFVDADGRLLATSDGEGLRALAPDEDGDFLRASTIDRRLYAATRVPIESRGQPVGALIALEEIDAARLASWSELSGATIDVVHPDSSPPEEGALHRTILPLGSARLEAHADLEAERAAVRHARVELMRAGTVALLVSILGCFSLARSIVRPIVEIRGAVDRIRNGELGGELGSSRGDEIGDVARGIDRMARDLHASRAELDLRIDELDRSQTHLANAQHIARIGSFEVDLQSGAVSGSKEFFAVMGLAPEAGEAKLDPKDLIDRVHEIDRDSVRETIYECIRSGTSARLDHRIIVDGSERVMHSQLFIVRDEETGHAHLEGTVQDVTERRRVEKQVEFLAHHDSLTGLGNRLHFKKRLEIEIAQARRKRLGIGIFVLDLDHFKRINDTLGHSAGDRFLQVVADRILAAVRDEGHPTGHHDPANEVSLSRLGGDEFTLLWPNLRDPNALAPVAQRILDRLRRPVNLSGHEIVVGASIGIATWPQDGEDIDTLLRNADSAMYHSKSNGRNTYQYYEQSMNAAASSRLKTESRLRRAIEEESLEVHYQPRISLDTGHTIGYEALARWTDEDLGTISPDEFIPIAEQTGLIVPLGRFILRRACLQALEWERGETHFAGRISVNVSARQFKTIDVAREIANVISETQVNPLRLEIEITESLIVHDEERVIETLHQIHEMGLTIALDDFGTGYSSLSYLRRLPVDVIKIDMAFVRGIARNDGDAALARAIIAMANALGLSVVAEGVETVAQRELLREWGCDEMQGFLASPALPPDEAKTWIGR
jgi:diguanylate cyclase (GGDEF)-like protein/PAS domain S-box-containing protein